jgi:SNF2 family DNA or RNA helicase
VDSFLAERGIYGDPKLDDGDSKVVIASQFTSMINLWAEALRAKGIECLVMTGETNKGDAFARMQRQFQAKGGPRVLLLNTMAGGVSITLDAADDMAIMDETWVPDDQEQVEDRIHRTSRTDHQVTIWYVRSEGTIERDLAGSNIIKDDRQKRSLDGRRGIEVARQKWSA